MRPLICLAQKVGSPFEHCSPDSHAVFVFSLVVLVFMYTTNMLNATECYGFASKNHIKCSRYLFSVSLVLKILWEKLQRALIKYVYTRMYDVNTQRDCIWGRA